MPGLRIVGEYWRQDPKPRIVLSRRRPVDVRSSPTVKCPGCGRPCKVVCRGCEARGRG